MTAVMIGVDPHKRSNTALVLDEHENVLATQRFTNDRDGHRELKRFAKTWRDRTWAVEGARGVGLGLAQRLAAEGEKVLNVPAKLSARVRALGGGSGRKTDDTDAYAIAVAGLRARNLELVSPDDTVTVLKLLSDRRQQLVEQRIAAVNRLHQLLQELLPGGASRRLTATKAREILSGVRPRDQVGKARKQLALEHLADVAELDGKLKAMAKRIEAVLADDPSAVTEIKGALVQIRFPGPGRDYYLRKRAAGKSPLEAMRCLKRRLSDVVYQALLADLEPRQEAADPEGHSGATLQSSASDPTPMVSPSDQSQPGPAKPHATPRHDRRKVPA